MDLEGMAVRSIGEHGTAMRHIVSQPWPRRAVPGWGEFLIVELTSDGKAKISVATEREAWCCDVWRGFRPQGVATARAAPAQGHPIGIDSSRKGVK
jgi:hypothetical protein